jgi:hypothetical protein
MKKIFVTTEIYNNSEQIILIQPTPEFDGIELFIKETDGNSYSGALYITKEELPVIVLRLNEMMDYVTKKQ